MIKCLYKIIENIIICLTQLRKKAGDLQQSSRELQTLNSTITSNFNHHFKSENQRRKAKILYEKDEILRLIFFSTLAIFGMTFAIAAATITNGYLITIVAVIIGIMIGAVLGIYIGSFIVDKIPDFKNARVMIVSNNEVIIQNGPRNKFLIWYLSW